jgi:hypothetical protein
MELSRMGPLASPPQVGVPTWSDCVDGLLKNLGLFDNDSGKVALTGTVGPRKTTSIVG